MQYVCIIPKDPEFCVPDKQEFLISHAGELDEINDTAEYWGKIHHAKKEDIIIVPLYLSHDAILKKYPFGVLLKDEVDSFLKDNEKFRPLSDLAAKKLAEYPSFFDPDKATVEAKEKFEEAKKNIPTK